jgi:basic membrane protein A
MVAMLLLSRAGRVIWVLFAAAVLLLAAGGCRGRSAGAPPEALQVRVLAAEPGSPTVRAASKGLEQVAAELRAGTGLVLRSSDRERREALRELSADRVDLMFCIGSSLEAAVYTESRTYPDVRYVLVPGSPQGTNVAGMRFQLQEPAFLGGVLAGLLSQGGHVGAIQGENEPLLDQVGDAFLAGARSEDPGTELIRTEGPEGPWVLAAQGVRVALYTAQVADRAVMAAAHDAGVQLILTDPEAMAELPDVVLAAITVDLPEAMLRVAREVRDGTFRARLYTFDIGSGVVDLELSPGFDRSVAPAITEVLDAKRAEIDAGWFEIEQLGIS